MEVCASCGVASPRPGLPCEACGMRDTVRALAPRTSGYFVQLKARFQCRGCGRLAPLDAVELTGTARCALCGLVQAFDPGAWREALGFAHGVGDLADGEGLHPDPRWSVGLANPHADVTRQRAVEHHVVGGSAVVGGAAIERSLHVEAAPGHPRCPKCRGSLDVTAESVGRLRATCECGHEARYDVSAAVLGACRGLRGLLGEPARADLQEARAVEQNGVVALACPGCGAPLRALGAARTIECGHCHLVARFPGDAPATGQDREPAPFWCLFDGPSGRRAALLRGAGEEPIRPVPEAPGSLWRGLLPAAVVGGGATAAVGLVLFVLLRLGFFARELLLP